MEFTERNTEIQPRQTYETRYVQSLFNSIAFRYDILNHILSAGIDRSWRTSAVKLLQPFHPKKILDIATGTADLAISECSLNPESIIGIDVSEKMLELGIKKIQKRNLSQTVTLQFGNAEAMEFPDSSFDAVTVSFGVRNFSDLGKGLLEIFRVLRPGGAVMILEFSHPRHFPVKQLYRFYSRWILPSLGTFIIHDRSASTYLPKTISEFPDGESFGRFLSIAGFTNIHYHPLTFGIATAYLAEKPYTGNKKNL